MRLIDKVIVILYFYGPVLSHIHVTRFPYEICSGMFTSVCLVCSGMCKYHPPSQPLFWTFYVLVRSVKHQQRLVLQFTLTPYQRPHLFCFFPDYSVERVVRMWRCAAEILTRAMDDKVYKVYLSSIKALQTLIVSTREAEGGEDKSWLRPIIQSILLKVSLFSSFFVSFLLAFFSFSFSFFLSFFFKFQFKKIVCCQIGTL